VKVPLDRLFGSWAAAWPRPKPGKEDEVSAAAGAGLKEIGQICVPLLMLAGAKALA
jgi:hypothetical protein